MAPHRWSQADAPDFLTRAGHTIDRLTATVAPAWTVRRQRARMAGAVLQRHYEAASSGRRTQTWNRSGSDANSALGPALAFLRNAARDVVRNNPYAESALNTIADHAVGWGIEPKPNGGNPRVIAAWERWANKPTCDADGINNFAGLQHLAMRTIAESGEVLVRRRWRRLEDGLPLPFQIQVMEPDFLDTGKDGRIGTNRIIQGVEFDPLGRRVAYWLFPTHPGGSGLGMEPSRRVDAADICHVFKSTRAGQVRAATWFAVVLLKLKDFDEYDDATLMKQKIAACLAVVTTNIDGDESPIGAVSSEQPMVEALEPGMITHLGAGKNIEVVQPPSAADYSPFSTTQLRAIATGLGVTHEDLTGDYSGMPFSAARMSRLRHWARVNDWRWRMLIPRMCDPVWDWFLEGAIVGGALNPLEAMPDGRHLGALWTAPPMPMIEPDKEGLAAKRSIRSGITTLYEVLRERGYDPKAVLAEIAESNAELDRLGIVVDSDPRHVTEAGQKHQAAAEATPAAAAETPPDEAA